MNVRICSLKGQLSPEFVLLCVCCLLFSFLFFFFFALLLPLHHSKNSKSPLLVRLTADSTANWSKDPPPLLLLLLHPHHGSTVFLLKALCCAHVSMGINFHFQDSSIHTHAGNPVTVQYFFLMLRHLCLPPTVLSHGYIYISMRSEWAERVGSTPNDSSVGILMSSLWTLSAEL